MNQIVDLDRWLADQRAPAPDSFVVEILMPGDVDDGPPGSRVPGVAIPPDRPRRFHDAIRPRHQRTGRVGTL